MSANISRDEWLAAVGDAVQPVDPNALTIREFSEMFSVSIATANRLITEMVASGRAVRTVKAATGAAGVTKRVPAYKLVKHEARPATRRR